MQAIGIVDKPSNHSVDQTVEKLKNILKFKGVIHIGNSITAARRIRNHTEHPCLRLSGCRKR